MDAQADWLPVALRLLVGLTLFLYGLEKIQFALKNLFGAYAERQLGKLTDPPWRSMAMGAGVAALLLSGTVTLEIVANLTALNLLSSAQAFHVILGSEIGITLLTHLMTLPITAYAGLPMIVGLFWYFTNFSPPCKITGHLFFGLGVLLFALSVLSDTLRPLHGGLTLWAPLGNPWLGLPVIALATGLLGSSTATMGILLILAFQELLPLSTGLYWTLGANLGAVLSFLPFVRQQPRVRLRMVVALVLFKTVGVLVVAGWVPQLVSWSPREVAVPYLLALFHTLFNGVSALLLAPLIPLIVRFANRVAPDQYSAELVTPAFNSSYWPKYLDDTLLSTPSLALAMARREVKLIATLLDEMFALIPETVFTGDLKKIVKLRKMDDRVDEIHQAITRYLARISNANPAPHMVDELLATMTVINELESIGDIIENNFSHLAEVCARERVVLSPEILITLGEYHLSVQKALQNATAAYLSNNHPLAVKVMSLKDEISHMDAQCRLYQMQSLQAQRPGEDPFAAYTLQMDLFENFKRIYYHTKRIAKVVAAG
ncbi:MAG: Na/Pi cotransporter family protein [Magnetococcales bacterium]|nr:Na/Pi cotransporter family protein [Magnetococcales bacterium]